MESSDAETGMVDCSVGTIVWVRRRNGSWWPGKILGPDELSASHLMSPRSGTPVKLLGREDASVDWYNLEKSKRVKPFRCGEFDDCIERAEASQGMPPKKREKYARREDAILHALELEKQVLEKRYGKQSNGLSTKLNTTSELLSRDSVDDKRKGQLDDNVQQAPSFRELVPFKHNKNVSHSHGVIAPENTLTVGSKKVVEKRKRAQEGNNIMIEESVGKRRDRHRPLVQVLQSSAKLQPNTKAADGGGGEEQRETHPPDQQVEVEVQVEVEKIALNLSNGNSSVSNEDTETDSSGTESLMSDTYDDAMAALSDEAEDMEFIPKAFGRCESIGTVSKWQLKGKRNSRSSRQWMMMMMGEEEYDGCRLLIDVEVGVQQSGYQREHVPMISLMSKLNDKAIVGHPIPVQALEEEDASSLLSEMEMLQPWRTAKCRPPHLSTLEEEEYYDGSKGRLKKPQRRSTSSCTSQKIRTLSSIQGEQGMMIMMMMKPESLPTAVACIPVKLVFSRLHEDLLANAPRHQ